MEHGTYVHDFNLGQYKRLWLDADDGVEQTSKIEKIVPLECETGLSLKRPDTVDDHEQGQGGTWRGGPD